MISALLDWIAAHAAYAGFVVFIISALESLAVVGILVPGMAIMLGVGTLVGLGTLPFWPTFFWAVLGAMVGDGISYWLGHHYDQQLRHIWPFTKHPKLIPKGEEFFHRHGAMSIMFGRFIGPLRAIVPAIAGMMHMPAGLFYLMNALSALAWAPVVILPGAVFGASMQLASDVALRLGVLLVVVAFIIWCIGWVLHRWALCIAGWISEAFNIRLRFIAPSVYALFLVGILLTTVFAVPAKPPQLPANFVPSQWWEAQWQAVSRENPRSNIQSLGDLSSMRQFLVETGWYDPPKLTIKSALKWLAPEFKVEELPLQFSSLSLGIGRMLKRIKGDRQDIVMVLPSDSPNAVFLLELSIKPVVKNRDIYMGVGSIRKLTVSAGDYGLNIPSLEPAAIPVKFLDQLAKHPEFEHMHSEFENSRVLLVRKHRDHTQGLRD